MGISLGINLKKIWNALAGKAPLVSPTFTGTVTAPAFTGSGAGLTNLPLPLATTLAGYGIADGVATGGSYDNPAWITGVDVKKLESKVTTGGKNTRIPQSLIYSGVTGEDGSAGGWISNLFASKMDLGGNYVDPACITSLALSKITGLQTTLDAYSTALSYKVNVNGAYDDPAWLTGLAANKVDYTDLVNVIPMSAVTGLGTVLGGVVSATGAFSLGGGDLTGDGAGNIYLNGLVNTFRADALTVNSLHSYGDVYGGSVTASTGLSVGGDASVSGTVTAAAFVGSGAGLTNLPVPSMPLSDTLEGYGITDGVSTGGSYDNPTWLTLSMAKITGLDTALAGKASTTSVSGLVPYSNAASNVNLNAKDLTNVNTFSTEHLSVITTGATFAVNNVFGIDITAACGDSALRLGCYDPAGSEAIYGAVCQMFGDSNVLFGGQIYFDAGSASMNAINFRVNGGGVTALSSTAVGTTIYNNVILPNLPSFDPGVLGALWVSGGVLMVSGYS